MWSINLLVIGVTLSVGVPYSDLQQPEKSREVIYIIYYHDVNLLEEEEGYLEEYVPAPSHTSTSN